MDLTSELVFSLIHSNEDFPINFDDAWQWLGYSSKQKAREKLTNNFDEEIDYLTKRLKNAGAGRPSDCLVLTVDCFKSLAMMAGTNRGKEVRRYFLDCERELKRRLEEERKQQQETTQKRLVEAMVSQDIVSRRPKFPLELFDQIFKKRGNGWENRDPKKYRPPCLGTWLNKLIYDKLHGGTESGGVKDTLNQVNPRVDGRRKHKHHWHFKDLGEYHLSSQIQVVMAVARLSPDGDWDKFMRNIQKACPNGENIQLNLLDMLNELESQSR